MTDDNGDVDDSRRYDAFWAFRNRWLVTNIARVPERCSHDASVLYVTENWSRCLSCCHVVPPPTQPAEPTDLEKRGLYVEYLMASGRIKRDD